MLSYLGEGQLVSSIGDVTALDSDIGTCVQAQKCTIAVLQGTTVTSHWLSTGVYVLFAAGKGSLERVAHPCVESRSREAQLEELGSLGVVGAAKVDQPHLVVSLCGHDLQAKRSLQLCPCAVWSSAGGGFVRRRTHPVISGCQVHPCSSVVVVRVVEELAEVVSVEGSRVDRRVCTSAKDSNSAPLHCTVCTRGAVLVQRWQLLTDVETAGRDCPGRRRVGWVRRAGLKQVAPAECLVCFVDLPSAAHFDLCWRQLLAHPAHLQVQ